MVAEEFFLDTLPRTPILKRHMRWLVLRGENQSHVKAVASPGSHVDLRGGEILDAHDAEKLTGIGIVINVAEPWPGKFVRRRPCGENALTGILHRQEAAGFRMHHDVVAISQIVFESKAIRRIVEQARDKCNCDRS